MKADQKDLLEKRLQRFKDENDSLRQKLETLKAENASLLKNNKNFDSLFSTFPLGIIIVQRGKVTSVNSYIEKQLGYTSDEVIGVGFLKLVHLDDRPIVNDLLKNWLSGKALHENKEIKMIHKRGGILSCDTRVSKVTYNRRTALV